MIVHIGLVRLQVNLDENRESESNSAQNIDINSDL